MAFKGLTRVFPQVPLGRCVTQVGSAQSETSLASSISSHSNSVKVLALFASSRGDTRPRASPGSKRSREETEKPDGGGDSAGAAKRRRTIYVRVQYDRACIETLPLQIMRERHPQILIDYLLGSCMWSR